MKDTRVGPSGEIDTSIPNVARIDDYLLGGAHNFASDRALASTIERNMPGIPDMVRLNRAFLRGMFEGFELLEPGVVGCAEWHPGGPGDFSEETEANELFYAVVGKKG